MYMDMVPECTNISVGYYDEHRATERLDFGHLIELRDFMVKIDQSKFTIKRDPKQIEMKMDKPKPKPRPSVFDDIDRGLGADRDRNLRHFFRRQRPDYPESLTDLVLALHRMGVTYDDVMSAIDEERFDPELERRLVT